MESTGSSEYLRSIDALLDGELCSRDQQPLFTELAANTDLQDDFRCAIAMRAALAAPLPPVSLELKAAVLGIMPIAATRVSEGIPASAALRRLVSPVTIIAGFVGALLMYIVSGGLVQEIHRGENEVSNSRNRLTPPVTENQARSATGFVDNSTAGTIDTISRHGESPSRASTAPVTRANTSMQERFVRSGTGPGARENALEYATRASANVNSEQPGEKKLVTSEELDKPDTQATSMASVRTMDERAIDAARLDPDLMLQSTEQHGSSGPGKMAQANLEYRAISPLRIELRAFALRSFPDVTVPTRSAPPVNNAALGVWYCIDEATTLGLECGQESMRMLFDVPEGERVITMEQEWIAFWVGLAAQQEFDPIPGLPFARPYARIFAGGTAVGPMVRASGGLCLGLLGPVSVLAGAEAGALLYRQGGQLYSTKKLGFSVGLRFGF